MRAEFRKTKGLYPPKVWLRSEILEIKKEIRGRSGKVFSGNFRGNKALSKDFCEGNIPKVCEQPQLTLLLSLLVAMLVVLEQLCAGVGVRG